MTVPVFLRVKVTFMNLLQFIIDLIVDSDFIRRPWEYLKTGFQFLLFFVFVIVPILALVMYLIAWQSK